jgi:hypothetical protein
MRQYEKISSSHDRRLLTASLYLQVRSRGDRSCCLLWNIDGKSRQTYTELKQLFDFSAKSNTAPV